MYSTIAITLSSFAMVYAVPQDGNGGFLARGQQEFA